MATKIAFFETDPDVIAAGLRSTYENYTSKQLHPAQAEYITFNAIAYRLSLKMIQANETANRCMVAFATGPALDLLGQLLGVTRLPAAPATCTIRFNLVSGHSAFVIPAGIRVQSTDGQAIFITTEQKAVLVADSSVDISAECTVDGKAANDYAGGTISVILDPQAFVTSAANLSSTANGSDEETDDEMRERILLAPSRFSVAGPKDAYKFFAKSAHPNIADVAVTTGKDPVTSAIIPGQVDIYVLMDTSNGGPAIPDPTVIAAVQAICNDDKIRPLTDTVVVKSPNLQTYFIDVDLTLLTTAIQIDVVQQVTDNLNAYINARKLRLGMDVDRTQIIGQCMVPGVYKVVVNNPTADLVLQAHQYALCSSLTVNVAGTSEQ